MRDRHNTMPVMSKAAKPGKGLRPIAVFKFILGSALLVLLIVWQDNGRKLVELLADFRWRYIMALLGVGVATVIGVASGIIPAVLAARMDPVIAIRTT